MSAIKPIAMTKSLTIAKTGLLAIVAVLFLSSCLKDKLTKTYTIYRPIYKSKDEVLASIKVAPTQTVKEPGKLYMYGKYIFLNEINKGVHLIDNSNPSNPVMAGFIEIPGNIDIAVKGSILYADLYTDLLAIDITNPLETKIAKVIPNVFPERIYINGFVTQPGMVVVDWIKKDTTVTVSNPDPIGWGGGCPNCNFALMADAGGKSNSAASVPGLAGSMSRFAIVNDYMYAVNRNQVKALSISNPADPILLQSNAYGWNIETIFPFKDKLFIGSSSGMYIFSISNPATPTYQGMFQHARACDPVVADDKYAYVTLRAGTFCEGTSNQLDVIDVTNVFWPKLVKTYQMTNPYGLAKDGNTLFLCDGKAGLKVYNADVATDLKLINEVKGYETYDVIAYNKRLVLVASNGLHQFDYTDINNIKLLSSITVQ